MTRICIKSRTIAIDEKHPKNSFRGGVNCRRRPSKLCPKDCEVLKDDY